VVTTDREKLNRILVNLFSNAVAYSPVGSEVRCTACAAGRGFVLSVSNPTDALEPDDLPRVFDRFWRKDAARAEARHAGLGLSLVAAFCKLLGIAVEARLNPGKIFEIRLQAGA
jgi:signal transduction histidine kinase